MDDVSASILDPEEDAEWDEYLNWLENGGLLPLPRKTIRLLSSHPRSSDDRVE